MTPLPSYVAPKTVQPRPALPLTHANPLIKNIDRAKPPQVKYQVITREGQEIVVGRVKIQTPGGGHAFILRRFDTGAISLTTMFRAAFPSATEDAERAEANWVKANYDMAGANGTGKEPSAKLRLAGTWVSPEVAATIADVYALGAVIPPLTNASPDPGQEYRKSTKGNSPQVSSSPANTKSTLPSPTPSSAGPNPSKRRKEVSPAPAADLPLPRRTSRPRSPVPVPSSAKLAARSTRAAVRSVVRQHQPLTPASDQTLVDEDPDVDADVPDIPGPDIDADIQEQRDMIEKLKMQRQVAAIAPVSSVAPSLSKPVSKRSLEETEKPLQFDFKQPEVGERRIKSNRRVHLQPEQKSAAWGVALFAAGFAAMATLPNFFF